MSHLYFKGKLPEVVKYTPPFDAMPRIIDRNAIDTKTNYLEYVRDRMTFFLPSILARLPAERHSALS